MITFLAFAGGFILGAACGIALVFWRFPDFNGLKPR